MKREKKITSEAFSCHKDENEEERADEVRRTEEENKKS